MTTRGPFLFAFLVALILCITLAWAAFVVGQEVGAMQMYREIGDGCQRTFQGQELTEL